MINGLTNPVQTDPAVVSNTQNVSDPQSMVGNIQGAALLTTSVAVEIPEA